MINLKQLEELKAKGLIRDYTDSRKTGEKDSMKDGKVTKRKGQKIKDWIHLNLEHWCDAHKLELWCAGNEKGEFRPDSVRFDLADKNKPVAWFIYSDHAIIYASEKWGKYFEWSKRKIILTTPNPQATETESPKQL